MLRNTAYINLFIYYMDYPITVNKPIKKVKRRYFKKKDLPKGIIISYEKVILYFD
jgi:hypothetical protein